MSKNLQPNHLFQGLDIQSLTRILIGLVKCGAWGCFDEFNRLEEATLSSVSTHIQVIQNALKNNLNSIPLLNRQVTDCSKNFFQHFEVAQTKYVQS